MMQGPAGQDDWFRFYSRAETGREAGLLWELQVGTPVPGKGQGDERKPEDRAPELDSEKNKKESKAEKKGWGWGLSQNVHNSEQ